ncbi:cell division protein ZapE [Colwelliaceae bacterium BS250]
MSPNSQIENLTEPLTSNSDEDLVAHYQRLISEHKLQHDVAQSNAILALSKLNNELTDTQLSVTTATLKTKLKRKLKLRLKPISNAIHSLLNTTASFKQPAIHGIYLYGRVGRGKTMMMDLFYQHLAIPRKKRMHFHHFMEQVHNELNQLIGQDNPLTIIAKQWAQQVEVLCFDEFFVNDIADAMLLTGLFEQLFKRGVILVTTSNCTPEQLYRNGLQRQRFLPTIDLLNQYCQVISVNGDKDHRSHNQQYACYDYSPQAKLFVDSQYQQLSGKKILSGKLSVNGRAIPYVSKNTEQAIIYFDFNSLCCGPRSQRDYMVLARDYNTVLIANVPMFAGKTIIKVASGVEDDYKRDGEMLADLNSMDDQARRFIALIDEFYEQRIKLYIGAEVDIMNLYQGKQLAFEFARCESRLIEMQKAEYGA